MRVDNLKAFLVRIFFISQTLLTGCTFSQHPSITMPVSFPDDIRVDRSFISAQPCKAPCWYGLKIGESDIDKIRTTLSSLSFVDANSILEQKIGSDPDEILFSASCVYSFQTDKCIWIETNPEGKLRKIILKVYYSLNLESATKQLESPDYYTSDPISGDDACQINIYWANLGIIAVTRSSPKDLYCSDQINERSNLDTQIESLVYTQINIQEIQSYGLPWIP